LLIQSDNPFWSKKLSQDKTEKAWRPTRPKTKVIEKPARKRKTTASSDPAIDDDVGNPDLEVELDSLGLLFTRLIDDDACQDDAEASNAGFIEVTILSSDSEILPLPKSRRTNRKVKFSHPLAYLDPNFLMKTQQHEARRTTRHSGQVVTSAGLPNSPVRKRRSEVSDLFIDLNPKAGFFRQPLNPSDSDYQVTSHSSSGESSATQLPPLKTVAG
jgi:hypothetical protein